MWQRRLAWSAVKAVLPFQSQLRSLKRHILGSDAQIHEASTYIGGFDQIGLLDASGLAVRGKDILEIGTGWFPIIPLIMRLAGANHVILTDTHALLDLSTLRTTIGFLLDRKADLEQRLGVTASQIEDLLHVPAGIHLGDALATLGMSYYVPFDYRQAPHRVDAIVSHTVLEHISPPVLAELTQQWRLVLKPDGLILHGIDHSDHRANEDRRLSRVDFLKYSDAIWNILCIDPQDYTNRMRHSDYMAMFRASGYEVVFEEPLVDPDSAEALSKIRLAPRFRARSSDDLAALWSMIVLKPGTAPP